MTHADGEHPDVPELRRGACALLCSAGFTFTLLQVSSRHAYVCIQVAVARVLAVLRRGAHEPLPDGRPVRGPEHGARHLLPPAARHSGVCVLALIVQCERMR